MRRNDSYTIFTALNKLCSKPYYSSCLLCYIILKRKTANSTPPLLFKLKALLKQILLYRTVWCRSPMDYELFFFLVGRRDLPGTGFVFDIKLMMAHRARSIAKVLIRTLLESLPSAIWVRIGNSFLCPCVGLSRKSV